MLLPEWSEAEVSCPELLPPMDEMDLHIGVRDVLSSCAFGPDAVDCDAFDPEPSNTEPLGSKPSGLPSFFHKAGK